MQPVNVLLTLVRSNGIEAAKQTYRDVAGIVALFTFDSLHKYQ